MKVMVPVNVVLPNGSKLEAKLLRVPMANEEIMLAGETTTRTVVHVVHYVDRAVTGEYADVHVT